MLFLTTQLPYPPFSGGLIKSYRFLSALTPHFEVTLACPLKGDDAKHVMAFSRAAKVESLITEAFEVERTPTNWLKSFSKSKTLNEFRGYNKNLEAKIHAVIDSHDCVLVDHYEMMQYVPESYKGKVILHTHNAEYIMWQRFADLEKNSIKRKALRTESKRIKKAEKACCERADVVFAAPNDIEAFIALGISKDKLETTYHLGNDEMLSLPAVAFKATSNSLLFIGTLSWEANLDGLLWFIEKVWPLLSQKNPELRFYIVGKNPPQRLRRATWEYRQIVLTGFVEDTDPYYKSSRVLVVPLRFGSGIKVKVLDGMYRGIPCVTTAIGTEGLQAVHGKEIMIADGANQFAAQIQELMTNEDTWNRLQSNARATAEENYTWAKLLDHHLKIINQYLNVEARSEQSERPKKLA